MLQRILPLASPIEERTGRDALEALAACLAAQEERVHANAGIDLLMLTISGQAT